MEFESQISALQMLSSLILSGAVMQLGGGGGDEEKNLAGKQFHNTPVASGQDRGVANRFAAV